MKRYNFRTSFTYGGKRYYVTASTEEELEAKVEAKKRSLVHPSITSYTVRQWAEQAVPIYKTGQSDITRTKYMQRMRHCILDVIGDMDIKTVLPIHLQQCVNLQTGKSKRHINEIYQQIQFLFRTAEQNNLIDSNPAVGIVKPQGKSGTRRSLTAEERDAFLKVCEDDRYMVYLLMYYCGLRPSEAREARGKDIVYRDGKPFLQVRGTKTANAKRIVPIPDVLLNRIRTEGEKPIADHLGRKHTATSYERLTRSLYRQMNLVMGAETYRNSLVTKPLADDFVPYCLRHDYCTRLAKAKVDIRTAQRLMGHSDISLTANIYTHVDTDTLLEAYDLINGSHMGHTP